MRPFIWQWCKAKPAWGKGFHYALVSARSCYLYILFFAVSGSKANSERYDKACACATVAGRSYFVPFGSMVDLHGGVRISLRGAGRQKPEPS